MDAQERLLNRFKVLYELLDEIALGRKEWSDFWPAFEDIRRLLGNHVDPGLAAGALMEMEHAERWARAENADRTKDHVSRASAKLKWRE